MIQSVLESRGKGRENEFCRVVGTVFHFLTLPFLPNSQSCNFLLAKWDLAKWDFLAVSEMGFRKMLLLLLLNVVNFVLNFK